MLTQAVIQTSTPMTLDIESADPDEILILTSISGLTSPKVGLFTGEFSRDGGYYQGRRAEQLAPVFNFKLNPNYTDDIEASDIREMLYRMFLEPYESSDAVQILLKDDRAPDRYFIGYTETVNADHFTKDQTAQVPMLCMDTCLWSANETIGNNVSGWLRKPIRYDGSADIGLSVTMRVIFPTSSLTFKNNALSMTLNRPFVVNDIVTINTVKGQRSIKLNGVDIMASLTAASKWVQMTGPDNVLSAFGLAEGDGRVVITNYTYRAAWWGV